MDEFSSEYYINDEAIKDAIQERSMFNIIDHASGYKADFIVLKTEPSLNGGIKSILPGSRFTLCPRKIY